MKNRFYFLALVLMALLPFAAKAQPDSMLNVYASTYQEERIYMHYDKAAYLPGETIWFKAYLMAGIEPSTLSKNFYVECTDDKGNVLQHITAPIVFASAKGRFDIPKDYKGSGIHIKAYTNWMLNFDTALLYHKSMAILQDKSGGKEPKSTLTFFPEGGNLVTGVQSKLAFMANAQSGTPVKAKGYIVTAAGKTVDSFATKHNGLGFILFTPAGGETYTAKWKDQWGTEYTSTLPAAKETGVVIKVSPLGNAARVVIERPENAPDNFHTVRLVATVHKQLVYRSNVRLADKTTAEAKIPLGELPTGILQITLFDANWMPYAERVFFVKNDEYKQAAAINVETKNLAAKAKNIIELEVPDSLLTNMSLSITDADAVSPATESIASGLLLTSDIKGYVHNPQYYFANNADSTNANLDLVMLTHGWRRINWQEIAQQKTPVINYPADTSFTSLNGTVFGATPAQLREAGYINLIVKTKDSSTQFLQMPLSGKGKFGYPNYLFFDTITVFYQFNKKKELASAAAVAFNNGLLPAPKSIYIDPSLAITSFDTTGIQRRRQMLAYQQSLDRLLAGTTIDGVVVKSKAKRPVDELDDKYTSGLFRGADGYQFDMINDIAAQSAFNVFAYLQGRVPGLTINNAYGGGDDAGATWRGSTTSFFLNEMPVDAATLQTISMADVAYVKVMRPPFFGAVGGGAGGAIAVYTRKGGDTKSVGGKGLDNKTLAGYTFTKEFYNPNYDKDPDSRSATDMRTTLYWNPYLLTDKANRTIKVEFFNTDITKKFRVDLQGFDSAGKLISVQKVIQ